MKSPCSAFSQRTVPRTRSSITVSPAGSITIRTADGRPSASKAARCSSLSLRQRPE